MKSDCIWRNKDMSYFVDSLNPPSGLAGLPSAALRLIELVKNPAVTY